MEVEGEGVQTVTARTPNEAKSKALRKMGQRGTSGKTYQSKVSIKKISEVKSAPKGYHFTKSGQLKKGDADQDGDGGKMLRSDPLDKTRSKIPPLPEKFANAAQQAAVMAKLKKDGKYKGEVKEDIQNLSHARLKFHAIKKVPHGSYTRNEIEDEHRRRQKVSGAAYQNAKPSMNERKLTPDEMKKREKYADDLPDADFKKRYGDEWKSVKIATATKMAKESMDESEVKPGTPAPHSPTKPVIKPKITKPDTKQKKPGFVGKKSDSSLAKDVEDAAKDVVKHYNFKSEYTPKLREATIKSYEKPVDTLKLAAVRKDTVVKFKDGSSENLDSKTAKKILDVHKKLNSSNKKKLEQNLFKSSEDFMKMVDFAMKRA